MLHSGILGLRRHMQKSWLSIARVIIVEGLSRELDGQACCIRPAAIFPVCINFGAGTEEAVIPMDQPVLCSGPNPFGQLVMCTTSAAMLPMYWLHHISWIVGFSTAIFVGN